MSGTTARKLTTIFYADAVGFGRQMADDEDATFSRLQHYRELMQAQFTRYNGRVVNTWGDAVIAEFQSVVEAVRCAVDIQAAINSDNAKYKDDVDLAFRIGINLGDVMVDGDNLYGDGVNMAARLESLAAPGGISVSRSVYEFAHKQISIDFEYAGQKAGKAGESEMDVFSVRIGQENPRPKVTTSSQTQIQTHKDASEKGLTPLNWLQNQPKVTQGAVWVILSTFVVNLMTTGLSPPWFIYPTLAMVPLIVLTRTKRQS
ncbi:MAG: adenylate/guanylate cyclase domain-containing protein [Ahrensia sp.]|nr:adenylate/guanylate cyclase domain-containing protein [Ahrensia sp.]